jgi:hypothetical protein
MRSEQDDFGRLCGGLSQTLPGLLDHILRSHGSNRIAPHGGLGSVGESVEPTLSIAAIRERMGTEPMTTDEFLATFGSLPADDEG